MHQSYLAVQCHLLPQLHYHFLHINSTHCAAVRTPRLKATLADRRTEHWADVSRAGNKNSPTALIASYIRSTYISSPFNYLVRVRTVLPLQCPGYVLSTQQTVDNTGYCP